MARNSPERIQIHQLSERTALKCCIVVECIVDALSLYVVLCTYCSESTTRIMLFLIHNLINSEVLTPSCGNSLWYNSLLAVALERMNQFL